MRFPDELRAIAHRGYIRPLKRYLAEIADEDLNRRFDSGSAAGLTPLAVAVVSGFHFRDIVRLLLARGADATAIGNPATAPMSTCVFETKDPEMCAMLIDAGCSANSRDDLGRTPLMIAATWGHVGTIHLLLSRGADMDLRDSLGNAVDDYAKNPHFDPHAPKGCFERKQKALDVIAKVRAAGSWEAYSTYPRRSLLALRVLCEHGRAKPPDTLRFEDLPARIMAASTLEEAQSATRALTAAPLPILARLFPYHPPVGEKDLRTSLRARTVKTDLPKEIFWLIISFWRSDRDYDPADIVFSANEPRIFDADCDSDLDDDMPQLEELADSDDEGPGSVSQWAITPAGYHPVTF